MALVPKIVSRIPEVLKMLRFARNVGAAQSRQHCRVVFITNRFRLPTSTHQRLQTHGSDIPRIPLPDKSQFTCMPAPLTHGVPYALTQHGGRGNLDVIRHPIKSRWAFFETNKEQTTLQWETAYICYECACRTKESSQCTLVQVSQRFYKDIETSIFRAI